MRSRLVLTIAFLVVLAAVAQADDWYPGIFHLHTQFSDGVEGPAQVALLAKAAGAKFIIITDHYGAVDEHIKPGTPFSISLAGAILHRGGPFGWAKYARGPGGHGDEPAGSCGPGRGPR